MGPETFIRSIAIGAFCVTSAIVKDYQMPADEQGLAPLIMHVNG